MFPTSRSEKVQMGYDISSSSSLYTSVEEFMLSSSSVQVTYRFQAHISTGLGTELISTRHAVSTLAVFLCLFFFLQEFVKVTWFLSREKITFS